MCILKWLFRKKKKEEPKKEETPIVEEKAVETPVEEKPIEEKPIEEKPIEEKPIEEKTVEAPIEEKLEEKPIEEKPAEEKPKKAKAKKVEKPAEAPIEEKPIEEKPADDEEEAIFAEAPEEVPQEGKKVMGKYEFDLRSDGYHFFLKANNGQLIFDAPAFTTLEGAEKGMETFKKAVAEGNFLVHEDKFGRFRFVLNRKYFGENYKYKEQCEKCIESVKYFTFHAKVVDFEPTEEEVAHYKESKSNLKKVDDINWDEIKAEEEKAQKFGKFLVCKEDEFYVFYLLANNGQILFASRTYSDKAGALNGVESFKRCSYIGNFFIDPDKFGNYRFVLKNVGSAPAFIGESYKQHSKVAAIIESVKKFIVTAPIVLDEEKEEPETPAEEKPKAKKVKQPKKEPEDK